MKLSENVFSITYYVLIVLNKSRIITNIDKLYNSLLKLKCNPVLFHGSCFIISLQLQGHYDTALLVQTSGPCFITLIVYDM